MRIETPMAVGRVPRRVTATGQQQREDWLDFLVRVSDFNDRRRQQLIAAIYETRKKAAEEALTRELGRIGLILPKQRGQYEVQISDRSPYAALIRRHAEIQAERIIQTDRAWREQWAERMKERSEAMSRTALAREFRRELQLRAAQRAEMIATTEYAIAQSEAAADFYRQSGICDPESDKYWYFTGPLDSRTCIICQDIIAGNPYTMLGLIEALASAGAMAPHAYTAHPHERHQAEFRPPPGYLRRKSTQQIAAEWIRTQGMVRDRVTGKALPLPPHTMPERVPLRTPSKVSQRLAERVCKMPAKPRRQSSRRVRKALLEKWYIEDISTIQVPSLCPKATDQQLGDHGELVAKMLCGGRLTKNTAPFDLIIEEHNALVEVKGLRRYRQQLQLRMDPPARERKWNEVMRTGSDPYTMAVLFDERGRPREIYCAPGFGSFRVSSMLKIAEIDERGRVTPLVKKLPWECSAHERALLWGEKWRDPKSQMRKQLLLEEEEWL